MHLADSKCWSLCIGMHGCTSCIYDPRLSWAVLKCNLRVYMWYHKYNKGLTNEYLIRINAVYKLHNICMQIMHVMERDMSIKD